MNVSVRADWALLEWLAMCTHGGLRRRVLLLVLRSLRSCESSFTAGKGGGALPMSN